MLVGAVALPLAFSGALAGCGDDETASSSQPSPASGAVNAAGQGTSPHAATERPSSATTPAGASASAGSRDGNAVDRAFVRQMVPHHIVAVQMATIAGTQAKRAELKKFAKSIVKDQSKEIRTLARIAEELGVSPGSGSGEAAMKKDAETLKTTMADMGMSMDVRALSKAKKFDASFVDQMTEHHYGAIAMANGVVLHGKDPELKALASEISRAQTAEVAQMAEWKGRW